MAGVIGKYRAGKVYGRVAECSLQTVDTFVPVDIPNDSSIRLVSAGFCTKEKRALKVNYLHSVLIEKSGSRLHRPIRTSTDYCGLSI